MLAATAASCGNGDQQEPAQTETVAGGGPVTVVAKEYSFDPEGLVVERGGPLEIALDNQGSLAHNLRILGADGEDIGGTPTFQGGRSETATVELEPGTYRTICSVGDHEQLGMSGQIQVE